MEARTRSNVYTLAMTAVMAALIAAVSPFAIPVGPVSITLCTLALYFSPYILGWKGASAAALVYILLGMVGMPVFSKFQAGLGVLMSPTGGYILGYIPMTALTGLAIRVAPKNRIVQLLGMAGATGVLYAFGTAWYVLMYAADSGAVGVGAALMKCVVPFILPDAVKLTLALLLVKILPQHIKIEN